MRELKVVVLGPGGVGKSALTVQFISGKFVERYDPTVEDFYRKEIEVNDAPAYLEILDTAGTEQFASMRDLYIKNGQGFIIVYSLTSRQSFQDVKLIREQILRVKGDYSVPIVLAANKCDVSAQQREVASDEGAMLARAWGISYVETSAKSATLVNGLFTEIVREMNKNCSLKANDHNRYKDKKKTKKNSSKKKLKEQTLILNSQNLTMGSSTYEADSKADLTETTTNNNNNNNNTAKKHESTKAKFSQFNSKARKKKEPGGFFAGFPCFSDTTTTTTTLEQQKVDIDSVSSGGVCSCTKCCFCGCSDSSSSQRKISSCNSSYDNEPTAHTSSSSSSHRTCSIL